MAGVLASHPDSRDVHLDSMTIRFHGVELLVDSRLELNCGRRYGLIGLNGCGKFQKQTEDVTFFMSFSSLKAIHFGQNLMKDHLSKLQQGLDHVYK